jgi:hypothetical protein
MSLDGPSRITIVPMTNMTAAASFRWSDKSFISLDSRAFRRHVMNSPLQADVAIPDLGDISFAQAAKQGDSVLAHSLALFRKRLSEDGTVQCAFDSSI